MAGGKPPIQSRPRTVRTTGTTRSKAMNGAAHVHGISIPPGARSAIENGRFTAHAAFVARVRDEGYTIHPTAWERETERMVLLLPTEESPSGSHAVILYLSARTNAITEYEIAGPVTKAEQIQDAILRYQLFERAYAEQAKQAGLPEQQFIRFGAISAKPEDALITQLEGRTEALRGTLEKLAQGKPQENFSMASLPTDTFFAQLKKRNPVQDNAVRSLVKSWKHRHIATQPVLTEALEAGTYSYLEDGMGRPVIIGASDRATNLEDYAAVILSDTPKNPHKLGVLSIHISHLADTIRGLDAEPNHTHPKNPMSTQEAEAHLAEQAAALWNQYSQLWDERQQLLAIHGLHVLRDSLHDTPNGHGVSPLGSAFILQHSKRFPGIYGVQLRHTETPELGYFSIAMLGKPNRAEAGAIADLTREWLAAGHTQFSMPNNRMPAPKELIAALRNILGKGGKKDLSLDEHAPAPRYAMAEADTAFKVPPHLPKRPLMTIPSLTT